MPRLSLFAFILAMAAFATPLNAEEPGQVMIVIDGSGSMWGRIEPDKRAKIDIVRATLLPMISAARQSKIGLSSFGHRRRGDCGDVEIVSGPTSDRDVVLETIDKLNPKGKGPIAEALRQSIKALGTARPASLLVVTDGADNCQQDACQAAAEIASAAPGVAIHLVSLGVEPEETARLACIPKSTGGRYFEARDAAGIAPAIDEAAKVALLAPPTSSQPPSANSGAPAPTAAAPAPGPHSLRLTASLTQGSAVLASPIHWRVSQTDGKSLHDTVAPDLSLELDPGSYDVEAELGFVKAKEKVTVERGKLTALTIPLNAAHLKLRAAAAKEAEALDAAVLTIASEATDKMAPDTIFLTRDGLADVVLKPGNYVLAAAEGQTRHEKRVTLAAGNESSIDLGLAAGQIELIAAAREDGAPLTPVLFSVAEDDPDSPNGRRDIARSTAPEAKFSLTPGTYYVTARTGNAETRQRLAVRQGETVKKTLVIPIARLKVSSLVAGQPASPVSGLTYRVLSLEGEPLEISRSVEPQLDLTLKSGRYRIEAALSAANVKASQDVVLEPGKQTDAVLKIDAGEIGLKPPQGSPSGDVFWEIRDASGKAIWHTTLNEPSAMLAPGKYTVRLETRDKRTEAAFELKSGERRTVQLGPN